MITDGIGYGDLSALTAARRSGDRAHQIIRFEAGHGDRDLPGHAEGVRRVDRNKIRACGQGYPQLVVSVTGAIVRRRAVHGDRRYARGIRYRAVDRRLILDGLTPARRVHRKCGRLHDRRKAVQCSAVVIRCQVACLVTRSDLIEIGLRLPELGKRNGMLCFQRGFRLLSRSCRSFAVIHHARVCRFVRGPRYLCARISKRSCGSSADHRRRIVSCCGIDYHSRNPSAVIGVLVYSPDCIAFPDLQQRLFRIILFGIVLGERGRKLLLSHEHPGVRTRLFHLHPFAVQFGVALHLQVFVVRHGAAHVEIPVHHRDHDDALVVVPLPIEAHRSFGGDARSAAYDDCEGLRPHRYIVARHSDRIGTLGRRGYQHLFFHVQPVGAAA